MSPLEALPAELLQRCLSHLHAPDRSRVAQTSKALLNAASDDVGWRDMFVRDFPCRHAPELGRAREQYMTWFGINRLSQRNLQRFQRRFGRTHDTRINLAMRSLDLTKPPALPPSCGAAYDSRF